MKFIKTLLIAVFTIIPFEAIADFGKFVGAELQCNVHKDSASNTSTIHHINVFSGIKPHDHIGLELGAYFSDNHKMPTYTLHKRAIHTSIVGYLPLINDMCFRFGVGATQMFARVDDKKIGTNHHSAFIPRAFVGIEAPITNKVTGRLNAIWEQSSLLECKHGAFKNDSLHFNVGLAYNI